MHVSYADMRLGEKWFRAGDFLDFRRLGNLPWVVVLTSYACGIGYSFHGMILLMCLAIGYEVSGIWFYCFFHTLCHWAYGSWHTRRA